MKLYQIYLRKISITIYLFVFLVGCSSTRFIYSLADEFIQDEITYFLNLDEDDEVFLTQQISAMVEWHRIYMLPNYAKYITYISDKLEVKQYGLADITEIFENGKFLIDETVSGLIPYVAQFLVMHNTPKNIKFIEKKMFERHKKRLTELSQPAGQLYKKRLERLKSNFERFLGKLSDKQVILLEAYVKETKGNAKIRLLNLTERQKVFVSFLDTKPSEVELTTYLNKLLLNGHEITNPTYRIFQETSRKRFQQLILDILTKTSITQRNIMIEKLRKYANDFKAVSSLN